MFDYTFEGFRFVSIELGLVADLMFENLYTAQFYTILTFRKGVTISKQSFAGNNDSQAIYLGNLGKIVKYQSINEVDKVMTFVFLDGSSISMGGQ